jgi:nitroimidazol reductase NimA-like FMN-containing flavoprotein (pyridoxamine 5'-phosphate oxidase superfamily)
MDRLSEEGIAAVLARNGVGVLALTDPETEAPYPIPVAFGYDPDTDRLCLQLEGDDDSRKRRCLDRSRTVGFTVFEEDPDERVWRSVVLGGRLAEISYGDAEPAFAALARNSRSAPDPRRWGESGEVTPVELVVERWSGRAFEV